MTGLLALLSNPLEVNLTSNSLVRRMGGRHGHHGYDLGEELLGQVRQELRRRSERQSDLPQAALGEYFLTSSPSFTWANYLVLQHSF